MTLNNNLIRLLPALCLLQFSLSCSTPPGLRPADYVDPLIDSHKSRWIYFSSACRPFGMVNLSPDTWVHGTWNSGYMYDSLHVRCFSHIHAWHGYSWVDYENQPGTQMAHLFNYAGAPWLSQKWVRKVKERTFGGITIHLNPEYYPGKKFVIMTKNNSAENMYIQSAKLNGKPYSKVWFTHDEFTEGGKLELELGPVPNKRWGTSE